MIDLDRLQGLADNLAAARQKLNGLGRSDGDYHTKEHDIAADKFHAAHATYRAEMSEETAISLIALIRSQAEDIAKLREVVKAADAMIEYDRSDGWLSAVATRKTAEYSAARSQVKDSM